MFCVFCNKEVGYTLSNVWGHHITKFHGYTSQMYYNHVNNTTEKCPDCGRTRNYLSYSKGYRCICGDAIECKLCNIKIKRNDGIGPHLKLFHNSCITIQEYYDKYVKTDPNEGKCLVCGKQTAFKRVTTGYHKHCSTSCSRKSQEVIDKLSATCMKRYGVPFSTQSPIIKKKIFLSKGFSEDDYETLRGTSDFEYYSKVCRNYSRRFYKKLYDEWDGACFFSKRTITKPMSSVDHVITIAEGFKNNIPIHLIGAKSNLRIVSRLFNTIKNWCSITDPKLIEKVESSKVISPKEKQNIIKNIKDVLEEDIEFY